MVYPTSNLPTASQPWGREIQKQLVNTQTIVTANEVNNSARDVQLQANFNRVNAAALAATAAAATAQAAIDEITGVTTNIYVAGTTNINGGTIQTGTISATSISAGTLTGFTVQTASSGSRVILNGSANSLQFTDSSGTVVTNMFPGNSVGGDPSLFLSYGSTKNTDADNMLKLANGSFLLKGGSGNSGKIVGQASYIQLQTTGSGDIISIETSSPTGSITLSTTTLNLSGNIPSLSTSNGVWTSTALTNTSGYIQCLDTYNRNVASGRIMYVSSAGTYNAAVSSARYKQDITNYKIDLEKFLKLQPVTFRYKRSVQEEGAAAKIASGFIAEQADEVGMGQFVDYEPDPKQNGKIVPDNFRYIDFAAALHSAISQQQDIIKALTSRIEILEGK